MSLDAAIKDEIQTAYRNWLNARSFKSRRGQREMIAHIARTLAGDVPRLAAIEAGTGTGKTVAYCLAAIPIARALGKSVVITSATVALQEQVVLRDLPDLVEHAGLEFEFALAKGRGRYLCLKRLDERLKDNNQAEIPLFEVASSEHTATYAQMLSAFATREWNGELDTWEGPLADDAWRPVTTDHRGCTNNRCSFFRQCPFFKARGALDSADVIVANHDLLLSDLSLGGGAVLPEPEEVILIIDEAHHLPDKTQQHFSVSVRLQSTQQWVDHVNTVISSLTQRFGQPKELKAVALKLAELGGDIQECFGLLTGAAADLEFVPRDERLDTHRFVLGEIPEYLAELAREASRPMDELASSVKAVHGLLKKAVDGELDWPNLFEAEDWLPSVGALEARALSAHALLEDFAGAGSGQAGSNGPRHARWVNRTETDHELVSAPIEPGQLLREVLWQRCYAAICTSATLASTRGFERFFDRAGLGSDTLAIRIPSPFDFQKIAVLGVPAMESDPRDFDAHCAEVAMLMPGLLKKETSALVLFSSWRQMRAVRNALPAELDRSMHIQGEGSKQALINAHRSRVDQGEPSYLLGLASFAEGLDLPDDYCRHVVIVKLPFAVPDDPIDQAMAEWAEAQGRNAFYEISVPDAALKLVQACGRLIRHENDHGRITLLDKRVVTQRYGRVLLDSLPPYRREISAA
ncbi:MAG: ATP-dependent DNA helicase DinG [Proteobacteria bacterium]|nr:ATP-dependent DNA helicase DinG [Pseudomonadota bacterium]